MNLLNVVPDDQVLGRIFRVFEGEESLEAGSEGIWLALVGDDDRE